MYILVSTAIIHITFWQPNKIKICIIFLWLLFPLAHIQACLMSTQTTPAIKESVFEKHAFSLKA